MKKATTQRVEESLPALIKEKRKQLGMTLQELADKADLSPGFLSQAERGQTTPSLVSILKLVDALEVDISYFVTPPEPDSLLRRADEAVRIEVDSPFSYYRVDGEVRNKKMTVILVEAPPHATTAPVTRGEQGEEFIYVLSGELHIQIDDKVFDLRAGDSVHLDAQSQRAISNITDSTYRCLWIVTPPMFAD